MRHLILCQRFFFCFSTIFYSSIPYPLLLLPLLLLLLQMSACALELYNEDLIDLAIKSKVQALPKGGGQ